MSEGIKFEHYEVMRREDGTALELGRGAMGITYKAWDSDLHCEVALKVINPTLLSSQEARDRFLREARATAQLHHPNIATVFRLGRTENDTHFYAMEFCDGPTLEQAVKTEGPFPVREALQVAGQATKALILAEERRLMHRDIKPTNLILTERPGEGRVVKIIDFGLAKSFDDGRQTLATMGSSGFAGTAYFASPEQLEEKEDLDIRSDIYSLGACLWFMLTGHPPFEGPIALVMSRTLYAELPWESVANQPAPVIALLQRMMAKNRDERPPSAAALRGEIEACLRAVEAPSANGQIPASATETPAVPLPLRFHPVEEIAHDSMGRLFRAVNHAQNGAPAWYRLIDPTLTAVPATRRELEAQIAAAQTHPHPNFINVITAEKTDDGLAIIQDYVEGFSLFELLKHRGMLSPQEALLILQQLAQAADHATSSGVRGLNLAKEQVFVHLPGSSTDESFQYIPTRPLSQWPPYEIKANVLSLGDAESSSVGSLQSMMTMAPGFARDAGVGEVGALANLACELLGGRGGQTFTPIPRLTEAANRVLSSACTNAGAFPNANAFVEALRESAGKMTAAEPRHSILNPPPPPQKKPTSSLIPWLMRAAVLVVIVGGGLGYYYGIYLPREKDSQHRADEAAAQQKEQQRLADEAAKAKAAADAQAVAEAARAQAEAEKAKAAAAASQPATVAPASTAPSPTPATAPAPTQISVVAVATDNAEAAGYRVKATAGDIEAARKLGILYYDGLGVAKNPAEALKWLQTAADNGDAEAQTKLGAMYFNGWGVPKDYSQAVKWHQKAADQGNAEGLNHLGAMYSAGWGVPKDYSQAIKLYQKAADQGNADGQCSLGTMYLNGWGVAKDYSQALTWLQKAADQGNGASQIQIGWMYQNGLGVVKDYSQALIWYQKSADQGNPFAQINIGGMYLNGWGVAKDYSQALTWFQKAADQGNTSAQNNIGNMYSHGVGVAKDYSQALIWYQKAANQGNPDAQNNIAAMYEDGVGVAKDYGQALIWFQKSADQGNGDAQFSVGMLYAKGWGVAKDYDQAMQWFQKSANQGNGNAMHCIGALYSNGWGVAKDNDQALQWFQKAIAAGDTSAASEIQKLKQASQGNAENSDSSSPAPEVPQIQPFDGPQILQTCFVDFRDDGSLILNENFNNYLGHTLDFTGIVARHNDKEGLVIFKGGGALASSWDLQVTANPKNFPINSKFHIHFVLTALKKFPFAGWSFRGDNVSKVH